MKNFTAIFCIPAASMQDWMANTDEAARKEQMDGVMAAWNTWREEHKDSIVHDGLPLGKTKRVTKDGVEDAKNDMNYMMIVQAESHEAAAEMLAGNPHIQQIPTSYVDVMDSSGPGAA